MEVKNPTIYWHPHPILPIEGRQELICVVVEGSTIREVLRTAGIDSRQPLTITVNDRLLTVREWDTYCPRSCELINVQATVMGGGGGGGSNPMQIVAMIAIVLIAIYAPYALGMVTPAGGLTMGGMMLSSVIMIAGSVLVNAIFKPATPDMSLGNQGSAVGSPTYSLAGGSNRARPYESMPVVMGTMRFFPDAASKPYTEYEGNEQFLYQIFNLGLSDLSNSAWQIGTSPITDFQDYTWYPPDSSGRINEFPANVDTLAGASLTAESSWVTRTSSINSYRLGIDILTTLYYANNSGALDSTSVSITIQHRLVGSSTWIDSSVDGESSNTIVLSGASQTAMRKSFFISVANGAYDVRVLRNTADTTDSRTQNKTNWDVLRSYQADTATYIGQHRMGLKVRASEQLSGSIQQMSVMSIASANYWNGSAWVTGQTSNPAHWYMDFAKGRFDSAGVLLYGVGLNVAAIDLAQLTSWAAFCTTEGLTFNAVLDGSQTSADVLNNIAMCGFGSPTWASGKLGVVWDARNASPVAAFGMSNIIRGSFQVSYITEQLAEEVIVQFVNPAMDWVQDEVRVLVPNIVTPTRTSTVNLLGCTVPSMAGKFANYLAAQQYYRTRHIQWDCDFEGFVCQRGDVVLLSHDLTQWGYSGRLVGITDNTLTLDRHVPRSGTTDYLMLKRPDGTLTTYTVNAASGDSDTLVLSSAPSIQSGNDLMDHIWFFSPLPTVGKKVKIISIAPSSESRLTITATDEDAEFYAAWDGTWHSTPSKTLLLSSKPVVSNISISESLYKKQTGIVSRVSASFNVSGSYDHADIRYQLNGGAWIKGSTSSTTFQFDATETGTLIIEIVPISMIAGAMVSKTATLFGLAIPPANVTGLNISYTNNGVLVAFDPCPDVDWAYTDIRKGVDWNSSPSLVLALTNNYLMGWLPAGTTSIMARHMDTTNNQSEIVETTSIVVSAPAPVVFNRTQVQENSVAIGWNDSKINQPISTYAIYTGNAGDSFASCTLFGKAGSDSRSDIVIFRSSGNKVIWMTATDLAGNVSAPSSVNVIVALPINLVLSTEYDENWGGTITNGFVESGSLFMPSISQTWGDHFSSHSWTTIQNQIDAGFSLYYEPSGSTGSYVELHDIGKIIPNGKISVTPVVAYVLGTSTSSTQIEWSADNATWVAGTTGSIEVQATNVRYLRITFTVNSAGQDGLVRLDRVHVVVSSESRSEVASLALNAGDVIGTLYSCNTPFLAVLAAVASPLSSSNIAKLNVIVDTTTSVAKIYVQAWDVSNARCGGTVSLSIGGY